MKGEESGRSLHDISADLSDGAAHSDSPVLTHMPSDLPTPQDAPIARRRFRLDATILRNVALTGVLQLSNYALGLLTVPYLARVLGVEPYGVLAFSISLNAYLWMLIDWGFTLSATKNVARLREDPEALRKVFWETIEAKALIGVLGLTSVVAVSFAAPAQYRVLIILAGVLNMLGSIIQMEWFARGLEALGRFTTMAVSVRVVTALLTFLIIHKPEDLWLMLLLQGLSGFLIGALSYWYIQRQWRFARVAHPLSVLWAQIWDCRHYFLSQTAAIGYAAAAPLILSLVSNPAQVGLYAASDKLVRVALMVLAPINLAIYPRINALMTKNPAAAARLGVMALGAQMAIGICLAGGLQLFADPVINLVMGRAFNAAVPSFQVMALLPALAAANGVFNLLFLLPLGHKDLVSRISVRTFFAFLVAAPVLGWRFGALGGAVALIAAEIGMFVWMAWSLWSRERGYLLSGLRLRR